MRSSSARSAVALLLGLLAAPGARAQQTGSTPAPRRLQIEMGRGVASLRMTIVSGRDDSDSSFVDRTISLPEGAVVTAMRAQSHQGNWLGATLWPAAEAEHSFYGTPGVTATDAAAAERTLVRWESRGSVSVMTTLARAPGPGRTVELTMLAPTSYTDGRDLLDLSSLQHEGPFTIEVTGGHGDDQLLLDGAGLAPGSAHTLRDGEGKVALVTSSREPLRGSLAVARAGARSLIRARVDTPAQLGEAPREARVVIVLDTSRSMKPEAREAAVTVARAYLARLGDARAAVVVYDRHARALQPSLVSAADALASLQGLPPPGNGSRLDLALDLATRLLDGHTGPRRVLVLTDGLARSALTAEALTQVTRRTGALVHLGLIGASKRSSLDRLDDHSWATAARATGGLLWTVRAPSTGAPDERLTEELVRPLAIDRLAARWVGATHASPSWDERLGEGDSLELVEAQAGPAGELEVTGELWSRPVRVRLQPTVAGNTTWTRLAVGSWLFDDLPEAAQRDLARRARVVSPFHSLLAVGPGIDHELGGLSLRGISTSSGDPGGLGLGGMGSSGRSAPPDRISRPVTLAWQRCTGGQGTGKVSLEATLREVVDVPLVSLTGAPSGAQSCLEQALWQLDLEGQNEPFVQQVVTLGRG